MGTKVPRVSRQPLTMTFGVRIACFHTQRQGFEDRFGMLEFIGIFLEAQQRLHAREQLFREKWLGEEFVGARLLAADTVVTVGESGDHDYRDQPGARGLFELAAEVVPGTPRHNDVEQYQV